jgi:hypothetical protein
MGQDFTVIDHSTLLAIPKWRHERLIGIENVVSVLIPAYHAWRNGVDQLENMDVASPEGDALFEATIEAKDAFEEMLGSLANIIDRSACERIGQPKV